ncbi:Signal peptidase I [Penicillium citrinum]|uniref:Signal peptidase complex catalytic subunit SEC11 n=1 Tax=Penicillium citrinum TaxID=5077 RepID=A0A9W9TFE1_PENCI|nr:Signal peptidase I [Penicillium citrinum]KAJ5220668.1 Signal peptidase I [Penicillium citrinum]
MHPQNFLHSALTFLVILITPFTIWKALSFATASSYPIVVVTSESMEPAFQRGDILFLSNRSYEVFAGDIPVVWFPGNPLPMVHRALNVMIHENHNADEDRQFILTKGDNNPVHDRTLYPRGQSFVAREEIVGLVKGYLPFAGWFTIALSDYPWLKAVGVAVLGVLAFFT